MPSGFVESRHKQTNEDGSNAHCSQQLHDYEGSVPIRFVDISPHCLGLSKIPLISDCLPSQRFIFSGSFHNKVRTEAANPARHEDFFPKCQTTRSV
jgi:hypothetical protein